MTQDEIIEMAKRIATEASKVGPYRTWTREYAMSLIMQLVEASAAKEREACAQLAVDAIAFNGGTVQMEAHVRQAIEARGEA